MALPNELVSSKTDRESQSIVSKERTIDASAEDLESEYPEGGRDAVVTAAGALLVWFVEFGLTSCVGVFQAQYTNNQLKHLSQSTISWIGTTQIAFFFIGGVFTGRLFDSYGPTLLIAMGTILTAFAFMMMSLCKEYYQFFLAQGVVLGIAGSLMTAPAISSAAQWYKAKRGTMMGVISAGSSIGAIVMPIAVNQLVDAVGFPWAARIMGFICFAVQAPAVFMVKSRLPRRKFDGFSDTVDFSGIRDIRYILLMIGSFLTLLGLYDPLFFGQTFSGVKGFPENITNYIVAIMNVGCLIGRLAFGSLADKFGAFNLLSLGSTLTGICILCWLSVHSSSELIAWGIMYGIVSGSFVSLAPAATAQITEDMSRFGGRAGLLFGAMGLASIGSAPMAAALVDLVHGRFEHMIICSGVIVLAGAAFDWAARFVSHRKLLAIF